MSEIRFLCFLSARARDQVDAWLARQPAHVEAEFLNIVTALRDQPSEEWGRPEYSVLSRECAGLSEIRFKADRVQYRWLGTFKDGDFALLFPATKRDRKFRPPNACKTALTRQQVVHADPKRSHVCDF